MLLYKKYYFNTLIIVNFWFINKTGNSVYLYDLYCTILYYHPAWRINLKKVLGIYLLINMFILYKKNKIVYMGSYIKFFVHSAIF